MRSFTTYFDHFVFCYYHYFKFQICLIYFSPRYFFSLFLMNFGEQFRQENYYHFSQEISSSIWMGKTNQLIDDHWSRQEFIRGSLNGTQRGALSISGKWPFQTWLSLLQRNWTVLRWTTDQCVDLFDLSEACTGTKISYIFDHFCATITRLTWWHTFFRVNITTVVTF